MAIQQAGNDEAAQEEILRVALRLYQKLGPSGVTMDDVAKASGRSRTSLYYYYKNRDEIFHAVLDTLARDVSAQIRHAVDAAAGPGGMLYAFCMAKLKTSEDWKSVLNAIWATTAPDVRQKHHKMGALHKKLVYHEAIILNSILDGAAGQPGFRTLSAAEKDNLVFIIYSGLRGLRREVYDLNDPHNIKEAVQLLTDMIVKWMKT